MTKNYYLSAICNCKLNFAEYRQFLDYYETIKELNRNGDYSKGYATSDASGNLYIDYTDLIEEAISKGITFDN